MTATVTDLWRHPIKSVGREALGHVTLTAGQTLPGDRLWAVAHDASTVAQGEWARCLNFIRVASSPRLAAVEVTTEGDALHLRHPDQPDLTIQPDRDETRLIAWLAPLVAEGRSAPDRLVRAPAERGMTDTSAPSITLASHASHRAVEEAAGTEMSVHRWRCNIWLDGLAPWEEFGWVDQHIRLGEAEAHVFKRIDRCLATTANPATGLRDVPVLDVLDTFGHRDFSVGLTITKGGRVARGDRVERMS